MIFGVRGVFTLALIFLEYLLSKNNLLNE
jgi:hypothetical protein